MYAMTASATGMACKQTYSNTAATQKRQCSKRGAPVRCTVRSTWWARTELVLTCHWRRSPTTYSGEGYGCVCGFCG